jgi:Ran GTPase-activating protein (RanGAP) involved in mRNA processing and transport
VTKNKFFFQQGMVDRNSSLANQIQLNQIDRLEISRTALTALGGIESLVNLLEHNSSVTRLILRFRTRGDEFKHIAQLLQRNSHIIEIVLSRFWVGEDGVYNNLISSKYNEIGVEGAKCLAEAIKVNFALQSIYLSYCRVGYQVAEALKINSTLQEIFLSNAAIGVQGVKCIAEALKFNSALQKIDLSQNNIGDEGAKCISEAIKVNSALKEMDLGDNNIGAEGVKSIADAIVVNNLLQNIGLSRNEIGARGARYLAEAIKANSTLQKIDLNDNRFGDEGAKSLANGIEMNSSIRIIDLRGNFIGFESVFVEFWRYIGLASNGLECIAKSLAINKSLETILLDHTRMSQRYRTFYDSIQSLLEYNKKEQVLRARICLFAFLNARKRVSRLGFD